MADIHSSPQTLKNPDQANPLLQSNIKLPEFRQRIDACWGRFSSGLWGIPEGDIAAAYCADQFPKLKTFAERGQLYTNMGMSFQGDFVEAMYAIAESCSLDSSINQ